MPQLFLSGWIIGTPGEGEMPFALPEGTTRVKITGKAQNSNDANGLIVNGEAVDGMAWVRWINLTDNDIPFDYSIEPLDGDKASTHFKKRPANGKEKRPNPVGPQRPKV